MAQPPNASPLRDTEMSGFVATENGARCREFYEGKLRFNVVSDDPMAMVMLDASGRRIRVQKLKKHAPQMFTVMGWTTRDIEASVTRLAEAGVTCEQFQFPGQDARGITTFPDGARVAWFKDPDGNILSLDQAPLSGGRRE